MNNTGYVLVVYQDGELRAKMPPGSAVAIKHRYLLREFSSISVAAYDESGTYQGAESYTFSKFVPYNWQLDHIHRQEFTR